MLYLAALFFILTLLAGSFALGLVSSPEITEGAQYAAAIFGVAFFVSLIAAAIAADEE